MVVKRLALGIVPKVLPTVVFVLAALRKVAIVAASLIVLVVFVHVTKHWGVLEAVPLVMVVVVLANLWLGAIPGLVLLQAVLMVVIPLLLLTIPLAPTRQTQ